MPVNFPSVENADEHGILAIGGNLDLKTLVAAYLNGIFPWPISSEMPLTWFAPDPRGVIEFENFHISKSFRRFLNNHNYIVHFNKDFEKVIRLCGETRVNEKDGTWIDEEIINGYLNLFKHNLAYCVSIYESEELVGGVYGVCIGEIISGESMFYKKPNTSKLALFSLIKQLEKKGIKWIDTQMVTNVVANFGGREISRAVFMSKLGKLNTSRSRFELFGC